jgi:putative peptidoglycan lipid II flippase
VKDGNLNLSKHYFSRTVEFCLFLGLPTAVAFLILAEPIQITLFQRGAFDMHDAYLSSIALMSMAVGIPAFVVGKAFVTVLFAHQDTKAAVKIAAMTALTSTGLGFIFVELSKWLFPEHIDVLGVISCAFSTSLAGWVNLYMLRRALKKRSMLWLEDAAMKNIKSMVIAALAMAVVLLGAVFALGNVYQSHSEILRLGAMAVTCGAGGLTYVGLCFKLGALKLSDVKSFLKRAPKDSTIEAASEAGSA